MWSTWCIYLLYNKSSIITSFSKSFLYQMINLTLMTFIKMFTKPSKNWNYPLIINNFRALVNGLRRAYLMFLLWVLIEFPSFAVEIQISNIWWLSGWSLITVEEIHFPYIRNWFLVKRCPRKNPCPVWTLIIHFALPWLAWSVFTLTYQISEHVCPFSHDIKVWWFHLWLLLQTASPWLLSY